MKINLEWINEYYNINFVKILNIFKNIGIEINNKIYLYNSKNNYKVFISKIKKKYIKNNIIYNYFKINKKKYICIKNKYDKNLFKNIKNKNQIILIYNKNKKKYNIYIINNNIIDIKNNKIKNINKELKKIKINDCILDINIPINKSYLNSIYSISKEIINFINIKNNKNIEIKYNYNEVKNNFKYKNNLILLLNNNNIKYSYRIIKNINLVNITPIFIQERLIKNNIKINKYAIRNIINYILLETGIHINIINIDINSNIYLYINKNINNNYINIVINNNKYRNILFKNNNNLEYNKSINILIIFLNINNINNYNEINYKKIINNIIKIILKISKFKNYKISNFINYNNNHSYFKKIIINKENIIKKIGFKINIKKILIILKNLNIKIKLNKNFIIYIPNYKNDLNTEEDIIEEILRYNIKNINIKNIGKNISDDNIYNLYFKNNIYKIKNLLINRGYNEIITNILINKKKNIFNKNNKIINILNSNYFIRNNLIYGLIKTLIYNIKKNIDFIKIFEIGNCFKYNKNNKILKNKILSGLIYFNNNYKNFFITKNFNIFNVKNDIENILDIYNINNYKFSNIKNNIILNKKIYSNIEINNKIIGYYGYVNRKILNMFKIKQNNIIIFCIKIKKIKKNYNNNIKYNISNKYQVIKRDLSIILNDNIETNEFIRYSLNNNINEIIEIHIINNNENLILNKNIITLRILIQQTKNYNKKYINDIIYNFIKYIKIKYNIILK